jgi:hypothetical protein
MLPQFKHMLAGILALLIFPILAQAQGVSVALLPIPRIQFFSPTGVPLAGGCISTFLANSTTPAPTYVDVTGTVQNQNPLTLDSGGFATIYLADFPYKIQVNAAPPSGNCSAINLGVQEFVQDQVNAYQILNNLSNLFLLPVTADPAGTAGELGYRSDIPCLRLYENSWDCVVTQTAAQTLTNKTLVAPTITNAASGSSFNAPSITGLTVGGITVAAGNPTNFSNFTNGAAGTGTNLLAKLVPLGAGDTAVSTAITDTGGVIGIVVGGAGTSGINVVQASGQAICTFDASTTVNDYVTISPTFVGNCHDSGSTTYPTTGAQVIGRVLGTNIGAGNYLLDLFPPEIRAPTQNSAAAVNLTAQAANVTSSPILTPSANGFYRASCYVVLTQVATATSTLPVCSISWTDADSGVAENMTFGVSNSANTLGAIINSTPSANAFLFVKSGVAISYSTAGYASSGATPMQYSVHLRVEGPL